MPRARKQVSRFDPSPEAVASWNDTSQKSRQRVHLQARVRLGLAPATAAPANTLSRSLIEHHSGSSVSRTPIASRKRPRSTSLVMYGQPHDEWSALADLRANCYDESGDAPRSCGTDSSLSCSTSGIGSESDSSCPYASDLSDRNLPWRRPSTMISASSSTTDASCTPAAPSTGCVSGASDTDSEYCSDLISPPSSSISDVSSAGGVGDSSSRVGGSTTDETITNDSRGGSGSSTTERETTKAERVIVSVRLARSQLPSRWAEPASHFETCLREVRPEDVLGGSTSGNSAEDDAAASAAVSLMGLSEGDDVHAKTWLTSGFIDVVMAKFARTYPDVHFMPIEFAALCLRGWGMDGTPCPSSGPGGATSSTAASVNADNESVKEVAADAAHESMGFKDILGRPITYSEKKPVIFLTNVKNVHWNLLRVTHDPMPELQLFEPMGKPPRRQGGKRGQSQTMNGRTMSTSVSRGTGFRCIPREVYQWLDTVWPLQPGAHGESTSRSVAAIKNGGDGWESRTYSAITQQQQTTGFDCGVAALLYAEKCGQGQMRQDVDAWTTQQDMTEYRSALHRYVEDVLRRTDTASFLSEGDTGEGRDSTSVDTVTASNTPS